MSWVALSEATENHRTRTYPRVDGMSENALFRLFSAMIYIHERSDVGGGVAITSLVDSAPYDSKTTPHDVGGCTSFWRVHFPRPQWRVFQIR